MNIDKTIITDENLRKIEALKNPHVEEIIEKYINLCKPAKVSVITDSPEDIRYVRELAIRSGEESKLAMEGHTVHFDGYYDLARDRRSTRILITPDMQTSKVINTLDREEGLSEIFEIMDGAMKGKEALVRFFSLGPLDSIFTLPALQITDSSYVAHSEDLLYRSGYEQFKKLKGSGNFIHLIHSAGRLDERGNSKDIDKRRIYIDLLGNRVLTVNNQYAGNSLGLKKLALRLAIYKAHQEDWLTEHMFIMGAQREGKNRKTYFTGAFPSACGKTATAMIPGQTIVGDDIAYIRIGDDGRAYTVNIERGIFGIIEDVNPIDDPVIYHTLTTPRELIFSNVLIKDDIPYWLGMGKDIPDKGTNYAGNWEKGMKDKEGNEILPAHRNARYTMRIEDLENADPMLHDPEGVPISGIIYGGRDSDTSVPVYQSLDWKHGVFVGASLESESTAATLGAIGVRKFDPMANLDFLVVTLNTFIKNHLEFGERLQDQPLIFSTNYFLKNGDRFLNEKVDKKVWLIWMEGRVHNEFEAIETPIGYIPKYEDLQTLFREIFDRDYSLDDYITQFSIRIAKFLEKLKRIEEIYLKEDEVPEEFMETLFLIRQRLHDAQKKFGKDVVPPTEFTQ